MNFDGTRGGALRAFVDFAIEEAEPDSPPGDLRGISCIVCAYNEADRIRNILDVIVGHPTLGEVIVVNDGSTDDTEALIRSYPTIRVLSHTPNRGKTYALSRGIAAARYDHLMLLDADLSGITPADIDAQITPERMATRHASVEAAMSRLGDYLREAKLDALIVVGDDQDELYHPENMPGILVYYGKTIRNMPLTPDRVRAGLAAT